MGDDVLHKDYIEVKGTERYSVGNVKAFVDVNYINDQTFSQEYPKDFQSSISRFLQSTAEVSAPINNSRIYLLSQYWVNLQIGLPEHVPQKMPEVGYVLNPTAVGPAIFTLSANAANFIRSEEPHGQRIDIKPELSYSLGDTVRLTQAISLRETAYKLTDGQGFGSSPHREIFQYNAQAQMRFVKNYESFQHIVEPSVEFTFIPSAKVLPIFDSTELPSKTTLVQFVLLNKFRSDTFDIALRFSQPYDFNADNSHLVVDNFNASADGFTIPPGSSRRLQPTRLEGAVGWSAIPVNFTFDVAYDIGDKQLNNLNSGINFRVFKDISLGLGERYSLVDNLLLYTLGLNAPIDKHWSLTLSTGYDAKGTGLQDFSLNTIYKEQCWDVNLSVTRRPASTITPSSYSYLILLELKGIGAFKL
jgi:LPS-assembly protein